MKNIEKIKNVIDLEKTLEYIRLARESADITEDIMDSNFSLDEKYVKLWDHFVSFGICNESELDETKLQTVA